MRSTLRAIWFLRSDPFSENAQIPPGRTTRPDMTSESRDGSSKRLVNGAFRHQDYRISRPRLLINAAITPSETRLFRINLVLRGRSSAGRALRSQCRGRGFKSLRLHFDLNPFRQTPWRSSDVQMPVVGTSGLTYRARGTVARVLARPLDHRGKSQNRRGRPTGNAGQRNLFSAISKRTTALRPVQEPCCLQTR